MARRKNYLNNRDLYDEIVKSLEQDKLTQKAEKMLMLLAERVISRMYYHNPDDKHDCLQNAYLSLFKNWRKFNPVFTNAFAYFTQITKIGLADGWNKIHPAKTKGTISLDRINTEGNDDSGLFNL